MSIPVKISSDFINPYFKTDIKTPPSSPNSEKIARIIQPVFAKSPNTKTHFNSAQPDSWMSVMQSDGKQLFLKDAKDFHNLLKKIPKEYAYLLCLEAGLNLPEIDSLLDKKTKKSIQRAHSINEGHQIDPSHLKNTIFNEELKDLAPYLRSLDISFQEFTDIPPLPLCKILNCSHCRALTKLPKLPSCEILNCSYCPALTELPQLPNYKILNCSDCPALTMLPELPNCEILNCSNCLGLTKLPELPSCYELECFSCKALKQLPELPNCHILDCSYCKALTTLPKLPNCHTLVCSSCRALTKLLKLPKCQRLNCSHCPALTKLPELPQCNELSCSHCQNLTTLPKLLNCERLECSSCVALTKLPELPSCKTLDCSSCIVLTHLPELPSCYALSCSDCTALIMLPELAKCNTLFCSKCTALTTLSVLPSCTWLDCAECPALIELPNLPNCTLLNCKKCTVLSYLPELPSCTSLNCTDCNALIELRALPKCENLKCKNCIALHFLPNLPICKTLNCSNCKKLIELPKLPNCQELDCTYCIRLQELPELPNCQELDCCYCDMLTNLPQLPNCQKLDCSYCYILNALPELLNCKQLNCSTCYILEALPALPNCEQLDCSYCHTLNTLPALPNCQELDCSYCYTLNTLPALPNCEELDCSQCTTLIEMPETLPACEAFTNTGCPHHLPFLPLLMEDNIPKLTVEKLELKNHPEWILLQLQKILTENEVFPIISFIEEGILSPGVDGGGLTRELVALLMLNLTHPDRKNSILNFVFTSHGCLPCFKDENEETEAQCWQALADLFSEVYWSNDPLLLGEVYWSKDSLLLGPVFNPTFFQALTTLTADDLKEELKPCHRALVNAKIFCELQLPASSSAKNSLASAIKKIIHSQKGTHSKVRIEYTENEMEPLSFLNNPDSEIDSNTKIEFTESEIKALHYLLDPKNQFTIDNFKDHIAKKSLSNFQLECVDQLERHIEEEFDRDTKGQISAILLITQRMSKKIKWNEINEQTSSELSERLEGVINKELLLEQLKFTGEPSKQTEGYLKDWITHAETDQLQKFLFSVTGSFTQASLVRQPLNVDLYKGNPDRIADANTCSFTLFLPTTYPDQQTFNAKLETLLEFEGYGRA